MTEHHVDGCKELIEIHGRSMLLRTIDEMRAADVDGIVIVTSPEKPAIREHMENSGELERCDIEFVEQDEPLGLVDALSCARLVCGDEMLTAAPDNLYIGHPCPSLELLAAHDISGLSVIGIVEVVSPWGELLSDTGRVVELGLSQDGNTKLINRIHEKSKCEPFPLTSPPSWRCTGRMVLNEDFWGMSGETDVEMLDALSQLDALVAAPIDASYVDVGIPSGLEFALSQLN